MRQALLPTPAEKRAAGVQAWDQLDSCKSRRFLRCLFVGPRPSSSSAHRPSGGSASRCRAPGSPPGKAAARSVQGGRGFGERLLHTAQRGGGHFRHIDPGLAGLSAPMGGGWRLAVAQFVLTRPCSPHPTSGSVHLSLLRCDGKMWRPMASVRLAVPAPWACPAVDVHRVEARPTCSRPGPAGVGGLGGCGEARPVERPRLGSAPHLLTCGLSNPFCLYPTPLVSEREH